LQDRILGWCESVYGPRLICAATTTSAELVAAGQLAPPFHTRYSALEIRVPPLRERLDDLPVLLDRLGTSASAEVIDALRAYHWPGNVRELVDLVATTEGRPLTRDLLPRVIRECFLISSAPPISTKPSPKLDEVLEAVERRMIEAALVKTGGHLTKAAEQLGVFRTRLGRRLEALGISTKPSGDKPDGTTPPTT
jgi:DNA-binding NtrC family response regulator